jgi:hypothetical protein
MPTGTSTIFGVFQAILALLINRTNSALPDKLLRNENFASEIFCHQPRKPDVFMLQRKMNSRICAASPSNQCGINGFRVTRISPDADYGPPSSGKFRIKNS